MLAWSLFLGLALLFAAPVFAGGKLETSIRAALVLSGTLCAAGVLGPLLGDLRFYLTAPPGFTLGLPVACVLLAKLFARPAAPPERG